MECLEEDIRRFLEPTGSGSGYGYGYGSGYGYGYGSGYGSGYGYGDGDGDGDGSGSGYGSGSGSGYGYGYGYGSGDGSGSGDGDGSGSGDGDGDGSGSGDGYGYGYGDWKEINGKKVYYIDDVPTVIESVHGDHARGYIVQREDMGLRPCFIARRGNSFAHGGTLREAVADAEAKYMESRPLDERISAFVEAHPDPDTPYGDLFEWHHTLTGSCRAGREEWCRAHGYQPTDSITVRAFIEQTWNDYGRDAIRQLAGHYGIKIER